MPGDGGLLTFRPVFLARGKRQQELMRVLLHQSDGPMQDGRELPHNSKEVEAESVALLVLDSLELPGGEYCRGYIQYWLLADEIPEASARRIFSTADRILRAGREAGN
jgi:hypothetical protein